MSYWYVRPVLPGGLVNPRAQRRRSRRTSSAANGRVGIRRPSGPALLQREVTVMIVLQSIALQINHCRLALLYAGSHSLTCWHQAACCRMLHATLTSFPAPSLRV